MGWLRKALVSKSYLYLNNFIKSSCSKECNGGGKYRYFCDHGKIEKKQVVECNTHLCEGELLMKNVSRAF